MKKRLCAVFALLLCIVCSACVRFDPNSGSTSVGDGTSDGGAAASASSSATSSSEIKGFAVTIRRADGSEERVAITAQNYREVYADLKTNGLTPNSEQYAYRWENFPDAPTYGDYVLTEAREVRLYVVRFVNADGSEVETRQFAYGTVPQCSIEPSIKPDGATSYRFVGWQPALQAVTKDAVYQAKYEPTTDTETERVPV